MLLTTPQTTTTATTTATLWRGEEARTEAYVKELVFGEFGDIMPAVVGGGSTTYWADYHYTNIPASGTVLRGVLFGGNAHNGANAASALRIRIAPPRMRLRASLSPLLYTQFVNNLIIDSYDVR